MSDDALAAYLATQNEEISRQSEELAHTAVADAARTR